MKKKYKSIKERHERKRIDFSFPHVRAACFIGALALGTLLCSAWLVYHKENFWSSILANIFAGLATGLILCIISGMKQRTIADLRNKFNFLKSLHEAIMEYFNSYYELMDKPFQNTDGSSDLFDKIYSLGACASNVNNHIGQGTFREILSFDPCEYCKEHFGYDTVAMSDIHGELRDKIRSMDEYNLVKSEVIKMFKVVDMPIRQLNGSVLREIEAIEVRLESIEHSLF